MNGTENYNRVMSRVATGLDNIKFVRMTVDGSSGNPELEAAIAGVLAEYFELWKVKQRAYGPGNIAKGGKPGLTLRLNDKVQRLYQFNLNKMPKGDVEPEEDAWMDTLGYGAIGVMLHRGLWPGVRPDKVTWSQLMVVVKKFIGGLLWIKN